MGCSDAADANADRKIDISDAVFLLEALYLGKAAVPASVARVRAGSGLGCSRYDACP